jgi:uncharacterized protein YndB with AHSA1/START domain
MTVTDVRKDPQTLTMTVSAEFDVPIERAWQLWEDPRLLERWWGPPGYPATFVEHDLRAGGRTSYYMTGPEGDRSHGWWRVDLAEPPRRIELEDGFANENGEPNPDMPTMRMQVDLSERSGGGTQMAIVTTFPSEQAMEQLLTMGMDEGMRAALGQIDDLLRADAST